MGPWGGSVYSRDLRQNGADPDAPKQGKAVHALSNSLGLRVA